jgi:DNA-binding transcriptional ArsR family regulator
MPSANTQVLNVVSSPRRAEILRMVWNEESTAGAINEAMPDVTFGAVSQHLKRLEEAGLVDVRTEGRFRYYRARQEALGSLKKVLEQMWSDSLWSLKLAAEMEERRRGPRPQSKRGSAASRKGRKKS